MRLNLRRNSVLVRERPHIGAKPRTNHREITIIYLQKPIDLHSILASLWEFSFAQMFDDYQMGPKFSVLMI